MRTIQKSELDGLLEEARAYQLVALAFMYPDKKWFESFSDFLAVRKDEHGNGASELERSLSNCLVQSLNDHSLDGIALEYDRLFTAGETVLTPIYETEYAMDTIFAKTKELADLNGFYNAFGLQLGKDSNNERPDHVSIELEFMAMLLIKEAYARNEGWDEKANVCLDARKKFLKDHIGRWAPTFCTMVKHKTELEFYMVLAGLTIDLINNDLKDLKVKPGFIEPFEKILENIKEQNPDMDPNECPIEH
ncbi:MAG: molecular chaperone [Nitrososphaerales archaeon]